MDRRSFLHSAAAMPLLSQVGNSQDSARRTRLYRIDYYYYKQGG